MNKRLPAFLLLLGFTVVACTPNTAGPPTTDTTDPAMSDNGDKVIDGTEDDAMMDDKMTGEQVSAWKTFNNRALNYTVSHPATWFWRHSIREEIPGGQIDDYFITNPTGPIVLGTEFLGRYVVEVSNKAVASFVQDFKQGNSNVVESQKTVAGVSATRLSGVGAGTQEGNSLITYLFNKDNNTYRIIFTMAGATQADEDKFEEFVKMFSFNQ